MSSGWRILERVRQCGAERGGERVVERSTEGEPVECTIRETRQLDARVRPR